MSYAIFRVQAINTVRDLSQIGIHNQRKKQAYKSNPDIDVSKSKDNIILVACNDKYLQAFDRMTKEYKKQHEERMKTMREDRKKNYHKMLDSSNSVVADEFLFTATSRFFKGMSKSEIMKWANGCMDFVYNELGYKKEQVLHSVIHMDEKTPHIHCVVVPLIKKYDKRCKKEKYTISKKAYIKNNEHLSELQDRYCKLLNDRGFVLKRGIKGSKNVNMDVKLFKQVTKKLNNEISRDNIELAKELNDLDNKMKSSKELIINKDYVKVKKDTFDSMNIVIDKSKEIINKAPILDNLMDVANECVNGYKELEKENKKLTKKVNNLQYKNEELKEENRNLKNYIYNILQSFKKWFNKILHLGVEQDKEQVIEEINDYYDSGFYDKYDLEDITYNTTKEKEIEKNIYDDYDMPSL